MKYAILLKVLTVSLMLCLYSKSVWAQSVGAEHAETAVAILDTAVPFAIGAREGEQSIRGSFGWPTFQEGFVEGVYFRFDPDGYARMSRSPRLDEDLFEVICQLGTTTCSAKKQNLEIVLTDHGQVQIKIDGVTPEDTFFLSDRKTELPLSGAILQPLDHRLEALLSSGGDLIVRRQVETIQTHSLQGFLTTITYLRWVAQNQASFVFPRGWPVPSQNVGERNVNMTVSNSWNNAGNSLPKTLSDNWRQAPTQVLGRRNLQAVQALGGSRQLNVSVLPEGSANVFAAQAQGRSLSADANRFGTVQNRTGEVLQVGIQRNVTLQSDIGTQIIVLETMFSDVDVKLNMVLARMGILERKLALSMQTQPGLGAQILQQDSVNFFAEPSTQKSVLRQQILSEILESPRGSNAVDPERNLNVPIKKNILERLLEELNGNAPKDEGPVVEIQNTDRDFISLSEYINQVVQKKAGE